MLLDWSSPADFPQSKEVPIQDITKTVGLLYRQATDMHGFSSSLPVNMDFNTVGHVNIGASNFNKDAGENEDALGPLDAEIVSRAIGDLLPDNEDELLSGVTENLGSMNVNFEENDDFDLFISSGGLELDGEAKECLGSFSSNSRSSDGFYGNASNFHVYQNGPGSVGGEHPYGEHPSRTLFVRNINSNVEDSELRALFEQYGDIRTLYTACKHRGFVMISYYDIRAARSAMRALQNKPLRRRKLDIHFSIPKDNPSDKDINQGTLVVFNLDASVSNDELCQIFGQYGEVKEIRETPHKRHHKFIEFYDVRAAESALKALNRSDIAGKRIKLEPSRPGGTRRSLTQQISLDVEEEAHIYWPQANLPVANSPPGHWGNFGSPIENVSLRSFHHSLGSRLPNCMHKHMPASHSISIQPVGLKGSHLGYTSQVDALSSPLLHSLGADIKGQLLHPTHCLQDYNNGTVPMYTPTIPFLVRNDGVEGSPLLQSMGTCRSDTLFEHTPGALKVPMNGGSLGHLNSSSSSGSPLSGQRFPWSNSIPFHQTSSARLWQTPLISDSLNPQSHGNGFSGSLGLFVNAAVSHGYHPGSAPSGGRGFLERRHRNIDGMNSSLRGPGLLDVSSSSVAAMMMHMNDSHSMFKPGLVGTRIAVDNVGDMMSMGMMPYQHWGHMLPTGGVPFIGPRRMECSASQVDNKKQFQLDINRILSGEDTRTTLMIKNIPNKYTSKMLLAAIDENHCGMYDFLYLPIDFKNKCNVGYAFINMTSPAHIIPMYKAFNGKKWEKFNSEKVASLAYARIQGKAALVAHFQNSSLLNEDKRCRPILFRSEGADIGDQEAGGVREQSRKGNDQETASVTDADGPSITAMVLGSELEPL